MRNESHKQALNTGGMLARSIGEELHVYLVGRSKHRQVRITARRLGMSYNFVQGVASMQAWICRRKSTLNERKELK